MIIVTGGAGFIGCNIVAALNKKGYDRILVVDNLSNTEKIRNLSGLNIVDYMDKQEFYDCMRAGTSFGKVTAVFHQGACSDTMATDGKYVLHNNFTYSKEVMKFCKAHSAQFIYASSASVYGSGKVFVEDPEFESALNAYAWSKLLFDRYVRDQGNQKIQVCGLRYFNVYGPGEYHKGAMASVVFHFNQQLREHNRVRLFCGTGGYKDGEQLRDFVYVDDIVKINMFFFDNPKISGIFNAGTGCAESFNAVALATINHARAEQGKQVLTLEQAVADKHIEYIAMPERLLGKYQSYTQADISSLRNAGYKDEFFDISSGVQSYLSRLNQPTTVTR